MTDCVDKEDKEPKCRMGSTGAYMMVREVTHADQAAGEGLAILDPDPGSEPVLDGPKIAAKSPSMCLHTINSI